MAKDPFLKLKPPCKECPFIRGCAAGWLGPDKPDEVMAKVHSEQGYACHMSIAGKPTRADGTVDTKKHGHQCIGALLHAEASFKSYRAPDLNAHQTAVQKEYGPKWSAKILDRMEFIVYHGGRLPPAWQSAWEQRQKGKKSGKA